MTRYAFLLFILFSVPAYVPGQNTPDLAYQQAIRKADSTYEFRWSKGVKASDSTRLKKVRHLYSIAVGLQPSNSYSTERMREIDRTLYDFYLARTLPPLLSKADSLFMANDLENALTYYTKVKHLDSQSNGSTYKIVLLKELLQLKKRDSTNRAADMIIAAEADENRF